ncbi:MAG: SGNH/GDSL hydrolase family protein [Clostridiales bacterium]|nr:SGNH/GDSL hydrolase family protein [Clostridiales bacterium]
MRKDWSRVLFLGNSITVHPPAPKLEWYGNWGMAASCEDNDYVHILMRAIRERHPGAQHRALNIADFEREFWEYDMARLAEARAYDADLTIVRIGENVNAEEAAAHDFEQFYRRMLDFIVPAGSAALCVGSFWDGPVNALMEAAAAGFGCGYINIGYLGRDDANKATGLFAHEGVASHPGDRGMEAIARLIWDALVGEEIL